MNIGTVNCNDINLITQAKSKESHASPNVSVCTFSDN